MSVDNNYYDEGYFLAVERKGNSEVIFCAPENSEYFANQMLRAQAPELPKGCRFMSKYEIKSDCLRTEVQELTEDQIADLDFATRADAEGYFYELSSHADAVLSTINEIENSDLLILTGLPDGMAATSPAAQNYKTLEDIVTAYAEWLPGHDTKVSKIKVYGITEVKKLRADFETNKLMRTLIDRLIPEHKHENTTAPRVTGWYVNEKELRDQEQGLGHGGK